MNQNDMTYSKFSTLKKFMKAKAQSNQQASFRIQHNYDQNLIKKQVAESMRSAKKLQKHQNSQKTSVAKTRCANESLSAEKIDHFRSISIILNQQNVNLNQQKNFLLSQIRLLQEKDKKKKIEIKQLKQKFKVLQKDYFQLQKLNLSIKYKFQALSNVVEEFYKKDLIKSKNQSLRNHEFCKKFQQDKDQQNLYKLNFETSFELQQNFQYLNNLPISSIRSISTTSLQKRQIKQEDREHFPLSLKQMSKKITISELFQILQKKFETLLIQYRERMDQHIKKQYREVSKCIKCVRTCLQEYNIQKLSKNNLNVIKNKTTNNCFSISEQLSTSCFRSRQEDNQQIHRDQDAAISFEKYVS